MLAISALLCDGPSFRPLFSDLRPGDRNIYERIDTRAMGVFIL